MSHDTQKTRRRRFLVTKGQIKLEGHTRLHAKLRNKKNQNVFHTLQLGLRRSDRLVLRVREFINGNKEEVEKEGSSFVRKFRLERG